MSKIIVMILAVGFFSFIYIKTTPDSHGDTKYELTELNQVYGSNFVTTITIQEVNPAGRTYYDLQSNDCPHYIYQDPLSPRRFHSIFMVDPIGNAGFPDRRNRYFFSNDTGNSWQFLGPVPNGVRSGFPGISGYSDGTAVIMTNTTDGGGALRSQIYKDTAPGAGVFTKCDPGGEGNSAKFVTLNVVLTSRKLVFCSRMPLGGVYTNVLTSFSPSCSFLGYISISGMENASSYNLGRGADGRIGIAYISSAPVYGSVYIVESTDNGTTFGAPVQIWYPNYQTDSLGALRGIDIAYRSNTPCVVFSVIKQDNQGGYFPFSVSKVYFWSPGINGNNPVLIDSAGELTGSNPVNATEVYYSTCRPVTGTSMDNSLIYVAWNRARNDTDAAGNCFFDVYFSYSSNGGAGWSPRSQVTNNSGPLRDCRYVSISPSNHKAGTSYFAHLIFQSDSIPGSFVSGAARSLARMMYARIEIESGFGIVPISSEIPDRFALYQNYPNPFNPVTKIRFDVQHLEKYATLRVYDILGREVIVLVNEQLKPGTYEVEWDATNYPSGVYYYKLTAGAYTETRKMVLIK